MRPSNLISSAKTWGAVMEAGSAPTCCVGLWWALLSNHLLLGHLGLGHLVAGYHLRPFLLLGRTLGSLGHLQIVLQMLLCAQERASTRASKPMQKVDGASSFSNILGGLFDSCLTHLQGRFRQQAPKGHCHVFGMVSGVKLSRIHAPAPPPPALA